MLPYPKNPKIISEKIFFLDWENIKVDVIDLGTIRILEVYNVYLDFTNVRNFILETPCLKDDSHPGYLFKYGVQVHPIEKLLEQLLSEYLNINLEVKMPFIGSVTTTKSVFPLSKSFAHKDGSGKPGIAGVVYLNDHTEVSGGTDFFINDKCIHTTKMEPNKMVLYPQNLLHSGNIPKNSFDDIWRITQNIFIDV